MINKNNRLGSFLSFLQVALILPLASLQHACAQQDKTFQPQPPATPVAPSSLLMAIDPPIALPRPSDDPKNPLYGLPSYAVRLQYDPIKTQLPIVMVRINGGESLPFILATGYGGELLIDNETVQHLKLPPPVDGEVKLQGIQLETPIGSKIDFPLKSAYVDRLPFNNNKQFPVHVAGVVGVSLFSKVTICLDFERQLLELIPATHAPLGTIAQSMTLPLKKKDIDDPESLFLATWSPDVNREPIDVIVDTGSRSSALPEGTIHALHPERIMPSGATTGLNNAPTKQKLNHFSRISFASSTLQDVYILTSGDVLPTLGVDLLSRFRVYLDFRHSQMILEPTHQTTAPIKPFGRSILEVDRRPDGNLYVKCLRWADKRLSVYVGDEILAIDGVAVASMTIGLAQALISNYAGTEAHVRLRTAHGDLDVTVPRHSIFEAYDLEKAKVNQK